MSKLQEILIDESNSYDSEKPVDKKGNFVTFIASVKSGGESSEYASPNLRESSQVILMVGMTCKLHILSFFKNALS